MKKRGWGGGGVELEEREGKGRVRGEGVSPTAQHSAHGGATAW